MDYDLKIPGRKLEVAGEYIEQLLKSSLSGQDKGIVVYLAGPSPEGKYYVGQTESFKSRCIRHKQADGTCPLFHDAISRYGFEALTPRIIAQTYSPDEADFLESQFISYFNSFSPGGYNLNPGGRRPNQILSVSQARISDEEITTLAASNYELPISMSRWGDEKIHALLVQHLRAHVARGGTLENIPLISETSILKRFRQLPLDVYLFYEEKARVPLLTECPQ